MTAESERIITNLHNQPPSDMEIVGEKARETYPDLFKRFESLISAEARCPAVIENDETSGKVGDYIKQITSCAKDMETVRVTEKQPYLNMSKAIDGFFGRFADDLDALRKRVVGPQTAYLEKKKAAAEQKKKDEAERLRKEAAEKLAEAQRKEREAQEALAEQKKEAARVAAENAKAQKIRDDAAAAAIKAGQDEIARLKKDALDKEVDNAYELAMAEETLRQTERATRDAARAGRKVDRMANEGVALLEEEALSDKKDSEAALADAVRLDTQARRMDNAAKDPRALNVRTRGEEGSMSSLRREYKGELSDRDKLDLEKLRPHLTTDAINHAIQSLVDSGCRALQGALIFEDVTVQVR